MIPLMLYVPPALNVGLLDAKMVAGLSMVQVLFSSLSGMIRHRQNQFLDTRLFATMGAGMLTGSMTGSLVSGYFDNDAITLVFGVLAACAAGMMLLPRSAEPEAAPGPQLQFNPLLAAAIALFVGILAGIVGAGGGFILIPIMIYVLKIPIKISIGTSIAVVFLGAVFGAAGKGLTGQVQWDLALPLIVGSIPCAQIGGMVSKRLSPRVLHGFLLVVILLTCLQVWTNILRPS
jgi:uncharacterized membrane protein YfcA